MSKERLYIFDTTLRDGAQTQGVDFSIDDKQKIANSLDILGVDYIVNYSTLYPEIYNRVLSIARSRNMFELRTGLELTVGKDFYDKREELKSSWIRNYGICDTNFCNSHTSITYKNWNFSKILEWKIE